MKNNSYVILVVEDDKKLNAVVTDYLTESGFTVISAADGEAALDLFFENNHIIDLILLDGMLPKLDGYEVLTQIRQSSAVPVIMLTARETEKAQLEGLRRGADIYITKPFLMSVVCEHIRALLKRTGKKDLPTMQKGKLKIHPESRKVFVGDKEIFLSAKEYDLLFYLACNEKIVLKRDKILDTIWGFNFDGDIRVVDTFIKQVRHKLGECSGYIKSVYAVGYSFEVPQDA
jgi:DNA-binding response OmpR family regulator